MKSIIALACLATPVAFAAAQEASPKTEPRQSAVVSTLVKELPGGTGGLEVDGKGFVYSSDFGSKLGAGSKGGHRIFKIDPATGKFELFASKLRGASGSAIGPKGNFFQSNIGGASVSRITPKGELSMFCNKLLKQPVGIIIDADGTLFVANCGSSSITKITSDGEASRFAVSKLLQCPNGITLDDEHNLYVANFSNGDVIKIDRKGKSSKLANLPGKNNGHITYHGGFLYVVARSAHQIYRVSLKGEAQLFAGTGKRGHHDGPALEATFSYPNDLAFSPDGKILYVNENAQTKGPGADLAPVTVRSIRLMP